MDGWMSHVGRWQEYQINGWKGKRKEEREKEVRGDCKGEEGRKGIRGQGREKG